MPSSVSAAGGVLDFPRERVCWIQDAPDFRAVIHPSEGGQTDATHTHGGAHRCPSHTAVFDHIRINQPIDTIGTAFSHMGWKPVGGDRQRFGDSANSEGWRPPGQRCSSPPARLREHLSLSGSILECQANQANPCEVFTFCLLSELTTSRPPCARRSLTSKQRSNLCRRQQSGSERSIKVTAAEAPVGENHYL